jgi:LPXTG-motif cell wall-anchored protein
VAAGASFKPITVTAKVTALPSGTVSNKATVTSQQPDPVAANNTSTATDVLPDVLGVAELPKTGSTPHTILMFGVLSFLIGLVLAALAHLSKADEEPALAV